MRQLVVVTGASGFVGRHLVPVLKATGSEVVTVGRVGQDLTYEDLPNGLPRGDGILIHLAGKAHDLRGISDEEEYASVNLHLTRSVFESFIESDLSTFVFVSSIKAVVDHADTPVTEETPCRPSTAYGRSKLAAERELWATLPEGRRLFILRPVMIHGPGSKGNLALLQQAVALRVPYPLGAFKNLRSLVSIDNACFLIRRLIESEAPSGTFTLSDDEPMSTVEIFQLIAEELGRRPRILSPSTQATRRAVRIAEHLPGFPLTSERLDKLTQSLVAPNSKIRDALGLSELPLSTTDGLRRTVRR